MHPQCVCVCVFGRRGQCEGWCWHLGPHGLSSCRMTGHTFQEGRHLATLLPPCPGSPRWTLALEGQVPVTCLEAVFRSRQTGLSLTPQFP